MHTPTLVDRTCFGNSLDAVPLIRSYHVFSHVLNRHLGFCIQLSLHWHYIISLFLNLALNNSLPFPPSLLMCEPEAHRILQVKPILCSVNMTVWVGDHPHVHQPNNGSILNTKLFFKSQQVGFVAAVIHWLYFCKFFMFGQQWSADLYWFFRSVFSAAQVLKTQMQSSSGNVTMKEAAAF